MESRIVLGHPYSGALLWLFNARYFRGTVDRPYTGPDVWLQGGFGDKPHTNIGKAASIALLFDEIYVTPTGDGLSLPGEVDGHPEHDRELGLFSDREWYWEIKDQYAEYKSLLKDSEVQRLLAHVEPQRRYVWICQALNQVHVANRFNAAIFATPTYLELCKRLDQLVQQHPTDLKAYGAGASAGLIDSAFSLASLEFRLNNPDEFSMLRQEKSVQKYGKSFRQQILNAATDEANEIAVYEAMLNAINSEAIGQKIVGGFKLTSMLAGLGSLVPFLGTVFGMVGLGASAGAEAAERRLQRDRWWLLAPEISKQLSKHRIEKTLEALRHRQECQ